MATFDSIEEAVQFLADEVSRLSDRVHVLEIENMAHKFVTSGLISIMGQVPPLSIETIQDLFGEHADEVEARAEHGDLDSERYRLLAKVIRDIGASPGETSSFRVIKGGLDDDPS